MRSLHTPEPLAVKGRQHQLSLPEVAFAIEQENGLAPRERHGNGVAATRGHGA
jgi:hypothetical protein